MSGVYNRSGVLANLNDEEVLARVAAGEHTSRIATELGVHKSALHYRYAGNQDYQAARLAGQEIRLDESELQIAESTDQFNLARARERFRAVAWRAEREHPDRWGQRGGGTVNIVIAVDRSCSTQVVATQQQGAAQQLPILPVVPAQPLSLADNPVAHHDNGK